MENTNKKYIVEITTDGAFMDVHKKGCRDLKKSKYRHLNLSLKHQNFETGNLIEVEEGQTYQDSYFESWRGACLDFSSDGGHEFTAEDIKAMTDKELMHNFGYEYKFHNCCKSLNNKKESETMKNEKIVMNKATWTIFYSLVREEVLEATINTIAAGNVDLPPVNTLKGKKEIKDAGRNAAKLYKKYCYSADETQKSIPQFKRDSIRIAQATGDYIKPKFEEDDKLVSIVEEEYIGFECSQRNTGCNNCKNMGVVNEEGLCINCYEEPSREVVEGEEMCESCGRVVEEKGWSHCRSCNSELEKIEDEKMAKALEEETPSEGLNLTKNDMEKITSEMAETTFNDDGSIVDEEEDIAERKIREVYYFVDGILFPRSHKLDKLVEYIDQVPHSCSTYRVLVRRQLELSKGEWDKLIVCNLLFDRTDLYGEIGGFFDENTRTVTKVTHAVTGDTIFVDTQGYKYARYVGVKNGNLEEPLKVTPGEEVTDNTYDSMEGCIDYTDLQSLEGSVRDISDKLTNEGYSQDDIVRYIKIEVEKALVRVV